MAAVISGQGLGLFNSSLSTNGNAGKSNLGQAQENIFVNVASGNLVIQKQDATLKGLGLDISALRTYNSMGGADFDNNDQWRLGYIRKVELIGTRNSVGSVVKRTTADGYQQTFTFNSQDNNYISKKGTSLN